VQVGAQLLLGRCTEAVMQTSGSPLKLIPYQLLELHCSLSPTRRSAWPQAPPSIPPTASTWPSRSAHPQQLRSRGPLLEAGVAALGACWSPWLPVLFWLAPADNTWWGAEIYCTPAQGRWHFAAQLRPLHVLVLAAPAALLLSLAAGAPCYRAAPPGVDGSVSGRLDSHAVGQQAAAPVLWS